MPTPEVHPADPGASRLAAAAPLPATARTARNEIPHPREGLRDTIESIVIALILAFVFRAFVVEAFVIPTGSMAPTLYGAHGTIACEDCGTEFAYGLKDLGDPRDMLKVGAGSFATCPNCNHVNTNLKINDENRNPETGDRILVFKWPFDLGLESLKPARWDVTVFKDPADGTTNFIKRLVGLPDEVLMLADGDVYTVPTSSLSAATLQELEAILKEKCEFQAGQRRGQLRPISQAAREELDEKMRITRKTPVAQESLWSLVYDHDHAPQNPDRNQPRWEAARGPNSGWETTGRRVRFADRGQESDHIVLAGKPILAANAYNVHSRTPPPVSDQRVRFVLTPSSPTGRLTIRLDKLGRTFWAVIEMDGKASLVESRQEPATDAPAMTSVAIEPFLPGRSVEVSFENLDYRLALRVGGREVLASSSDKDSPAYYGPDLKALRTMRGPGSSAPPRIYGQGGSWEITHLAVDRDEYYYHDPTFQPLGVAWGPRGGWGSPEQPILLRGHEYFMLGDNTSASKDSRLWDTWGPHLRDRGDAFQLGTVPADQLIGKAFFVYWPAPHRLDWLPYLPFGV
ncbi:MAG: hypothetical protein HY763_14260, partial [Planctomycetes bacterium]|nr:hypothetical protein [Planctomycetota bacterium]